MRYAPRAQPGAEEAKKTTLKYILQELADARYWKRWLNGIWLG